MRLKIIALTILLVISVGSAGKATYISTKAWVAQILLHHAWDTHDDTVITSKPWPWADFYPVAKLSLPTIEKDAIVLNSHSGQAMAFGPGLIQHDNSYVLAGHRDSHFKMINELDFNDVVSLSFPTGEEFQGKVQSIQIIDTQEQENIIPPDNSLVLITCYPFDSITAGGPLRYVVTVY